MIKKVKLGEVLDVKRGASLSGEFYSKNGEKIRLTLGNFNYPSGGFKNNTSKTDIYFTGTVKPEFIMKKGDIITPLTEQVAGLLGETARIPEDDLYIQSGDIGLIVPNPELLDNSFAYYLLPSPVVKKQLGAGAQQTKIRHTSPEKIKDCEVWIPEMPYQKLAGALLDSINAKISTNNRINSELESMAKTIYDYWFTQFDFPDENGKPYKSSGGKMVWNEELKREIPEGWGVGKLNNIIDISNNKVSMDNIGDRVYVPIEVIPRNKMSFYETADIEKAATGLCSFEKKSILLSNRRVYFHKVSISPFDGVTRDTVIIINPKNRENLGYVFQVVNSNHFIEYATRNSYGTEQPVLATPTVQNYLTLLPKENLDLLYSKKVKPIIDKVLKLQIENRELAALRDWLLPMLMNGQVGFKEVE